MGIYENIYVASVDRYQKPIQCLNMGNHIEEMGFHCAAHWRVHSWQKSSLKRSFSHRCIPGYQSYRVPWWLDYGWSFESHQFLYTAYDMQISLLLSIFLSISCGIDCWHGHSSLVRQSKSQQPPRGHLAHYTFYTWFCPCERLQQATWHCSCTDLVAVFSPGLDPFTPSAQRLARLSPLWSWRLVKSFILGHPWCFKSVGKKNALTSLVHLLHIKNPVFTFPISNMLFLKYRYSTNKMRLSWIRSHCDIFIYLVEYWLKYLGCNMKKK